MLGTAGSVWAGGYNPGVAEESTKHLMELGLVAGTFSPNQALTGPETVAFLMKFLGIHPKADLSWPANYLQAAAEANLISTHDAELVVSLGNSPATRGLAFYLADRALNDARELYLGDRRIDFDAGTGHRAAGQCFRPGAGGQH